MFEIEAKLRQIPSAKCFVMAVYDICRFESFDFKVLADIADKKNVKFVEKVEEALEKRKNEIEDQHEQLEEKKSSNTSSKN